MADHATSFLALLRCLHFYLGFRFLLVDESSRTSLLMLSLLVDAGCCTGIAASCGIDVGDAGEDELEELVNRPGTTNGT